MKLADDRFNRRLRLRLAAHPDALVAAEAQLGVDQRTISHFRFGLSEPYRRPAAASGDVLHQDVLVAPVLGADGRFFSRYLYHALENVTTDNRIDPPKSWSPGASESYFSRKIREGDAVILCDDVRDLWALTALILGTSLWESHVLLAPTQRGKWPEAWHTAEFWKSWKRVNIAMGIGSSNGLGGAAELDKKARTLARLMSRDVHRLLPHNATSWLAARLEGIRYDTFHKQIKDAALLKAADLKVDEGGQYSSAAGDDVSCSYLRGFLFEALEVLHQSEVEGRCTQRRKTVVVRSDRTLHTAEEMPSPAGTPKHERVFRLVPDGALLRCLPRASSDSTWRWSSTSAFLYGGATAPPLATLLHQIREHLRCSVWLPYPTDYDLLSCVVAATYCQQVFDAVPLILVNGPKGSGKTELSSAISHLCANSPGPIGLISAATLTRLADTSHGFIAIDDLEKIMSKRGDDAQFSELAQALKQSYKKESALRLLTDVNRDNQVQRLNFFGIKLINNTRGVDEILGSRMLTISTRQMPTGVSLPRNGRLGQEQRAQLRDNLHVWAFSHVRDIARTLAEIFPEVSTRDVEIFAPIRVIAQLSGSEAIERRVDEALGAKRENGSRTATEALEEALLSILTEAIAAQGRLRTVITVLEVQMRLKLREDPHLGKSSTTDISDVENPEWIGRQLKDVFAPIGAEPIRLEMHKRGTRFYPLGDAILSKAIGLENAQREQLLEDNNPRAFCAECPTCPYQSLCTMSERKLKADARWRNRARVDSNTTESSLGGEPGLH